MSFDESSWIEATAAGARNPLSWGNSAEQLKRAADILSEVWRDDLASMLADMEDTMRRALAGEPFPRVVPVLPAAVLLLGLALENALKGVLVAVEPTRFVQPDAAKPDLLFHWGSRGHDLEWLAAEAGLAVSGEGSEALAKLNEYVLWAGRYPVALRASAMAPRPGSPHGGSYFDSGLLPAIDKLFGDAMALLRLSVSTHEAAAQEAASQLQFERRGVIETYLRGLKTVKELGVTFYLDEGVPDGGSGPFIVCVRCQSSFGLDRRRPAAICPCGTLRYSERRPVAGRIEWVTDEFPDTA